MSKLLFAVVLLWSTALYAQAPRSRAEAAAFCYDIIRASKRDVPTEERYRMCMFDLGWPLPKAEKK